MQARSLLTVRADDLIEFEPCFRRKALKEPVDLMNGIDRNATFIDLVEAIEPFN